MRFNKILNIVIILLLVSLISIFAFSRYQNVLLQEQWEIAQKENAEKMIPDDDNAINIVTEPILTSHLSDDDENRVVLSFDDFLKNYKRTSHYVGETSVEYRLSRPMATGGNIYVLNFKMRTEASTAKVKVSFGTEHVYYVSTQWQEYYMPCTRAEINMIRWKLETAFQRMYLTDVKVLKYDVTIDDLSEINNGTYNLSEDIRYTIDESNSIGVGHTMDITGDGKYLYSIGMETLTISAVNDNDTNVLSKLSGLGNVRHVEQRDDTLLAVASREAGVYLINIEDKTNPYVFSYYNSLEIANDVCFSGDFMFVAGRYFGVEIVDISDPSKPKYVRRIENEKECYRCTVQGDYLYVSCWSTGEVEIYDISIINNPVLISSIPVNGRCGEAFVDGNIVYIVSGYSDFVNADKVADAGYGTGNGVAIYDVSDIKHPSWCSTIKAEGSLYGNGYDDWSVKVSNGYVYFTSSFGGLYIYDATDIYAPLMTAFVTVPLYSHSSNYVDFTKNERTVFPYDESDYIVSPVMGVHVDDGNVFFGCAYTDVHSYAFESARIIVKEQPDLTYAYADEKEDNKTRGYETFLENYDIQTIVKYDKDYYLIATSDGMCLLDDSLSVVYEYTTSDPVKDIKVTKDGYIVAAVKYGVATYKIENNEIIRLGYVASDATNRFVSAVAVTADGKFAISQSSWTKFEAIDLRDIRNPVLMNTVISQSGEKVNINSLPSPGNMYYCNIVSGTVDGAIGIGGTNYALWFDSDGSNLRVINIYQNKLNGETNGSAAINDSGEILSVYNNGYMVYNPLSITGNQLGALTRNYIRNVRIKGKASVGGDILVASNAPRGQIQIINIADYTMPYLIEYFEIENSPGIALIDDKNILIPIRHGGIMKIIVE